MRDAVLLFAAFALTYLAFACFALAQRRNWRAVTETADCSRSGRLMLKIAGIAALAAGCAIIFWREGAGYGALLWATQLTAAALCVVATLSLRPRLLRLLAAIPARA
jgi:uncharacterized protein DUF3325